MKTEKKHFIVYVSALIAMLVLPMAGVYFSGKFIPEYLEFPPQLRYVEHAAFSWPIFIGLAAFIIAVCLPFLIKVIASNLAQKSTTEPPGPSKKDSAGASVLPIRLPTTGHWPHWGTAGILFGAIDWVLAWNRFAWFADFQIFTFTPLWVAYIVVVNAWTQKRTGKCMMTGKPVYFAMLFFLSAFFWWFFEYLNRFVQNWYYEGIGDLSPFMYFLYATLPFSTVLPAVLGTCDLLESFPRLYAGLDEFIKIKANPKIAAVLILLFCVTGLYLIGIYPNFLFPLLWVSPLGILASILILQGRIPPPFAKLAEGNWVKVYLLALSALICGFFWEMWNYHSLARWIYSVPYVNRFKVFEMPILGYSGYLPFGLECAIIVHWYHCCWDNNRQLMRKIAIYAILFIIPLYTLPIWWCSRDADNWYDGDIEIQEQLAASMAEWIEQSSDRENFSAKFIQFNGEWLFGTYMMAGMGFGQLAMEHPENKDQYLPLMEVCIKKLLIKETRAFDLEFWSNDPIDGIGSEYDHCSYLGYLNLLLSLHRKLKPKSEFAELNDKITEHLLNRLQKTPIRLLQTYPGEVFPVDNCAVFGSIGLHAKATGKECDKFLLECLDVFEKRYIDKKTGLLIQYVNPATGEREDHPRGSGTALGIYMLSFANPQLAKKLYQALKKELASSCLRFGGVKEYPAGIQGGVGDVDSGPVIFGFSTSATGVAISGARIFQDQSFFRSLCATLYLIGAPCQSNGKLHFITGGPLGNAIMFAMLTAPKEQQ